MTKIIQVGITSRNEQMMELGLFLTGFTMFLLLVCILGYIPFWIDILIFILTFICFSFTYFYWHRKILYHDWNEFL